MNNEINVEQSVRDDAVRHTSVEAKLGADKFFVDEGSAHIELVDDIDMRKFVLLETACPANLYKRDENGVHFDYAGCLECGTCRVLCGDSILKKWVYPQGGFGIEYRFG